MKDVNICTFDFEPNEYRRLGNMLVRVAKEAKRRIENGYHDTEDKMNYADAVLLMDKLGIPKSEVSDEEGE